MGERDGERNVERQPKRLMRGGLDPAEMAKRSAEARRRRAAEAAANPPSEEKDFRAEMEDLAVSKNVPAHVRQSALRWLLTDGEKPDESLDWKKSVQVRPDFEPPNWREVAAIARVSGCDL